MEKQSAVRLRKGNSLKTEISVDYSQVEIRVIAELVSAIDAKWTNRKSVPPKELVKPLERARECLHTKLQENQTV